MGDWAQTGTVIAAVITTGFAVWRLTNANTNARIEDLKDALNTRFSEFKGTVNTQVNDLKGTVNTQVNDLKDTVNTRFSEFKGTVNTQVNDLKDTVSDVKDALGALDAKNEKAHAGIVENIDKARTEVIGRIDHVESEIRQDLRAVIPRAKADQHPVA